MKKSDWYKARVIHGRKLAATLGFPTLNLEIPIGFNLSKEGVYASRIKIKSKVYNGVLYIGPRLILNEKEKILEIYVFDFQNKIYGETVLFQVFDFVRGVQNFPDFNEFKKQLAKDCQKVKEILK